MENGVRFDVHTQSDAFRRGWVKGFYDCRHDEGVRDLGRACRDDEQQAGYLRGRLDRLSRPAPIFPSASEVAGESTVGPAVDGTTQAA